MIGSSTSMTPQKAGSQSPLSKLLLAPESSPPPILKDWSSNPSNRPPAGTQQGGGVAGGGAGGNPKYSGQSTIRPPQYIDINTTEDSVNNVMAKGFQEADQRYQLKQTDKAGFSRGRGNQYMAEQAGVQAMTKAAADAAGVRTEDDKTNAKMRSDYEKARELEAQNLSMVQHSIGQANWSKTFAQQQNALTLMQALMNGQQQQIQQGVRNGSTTVQPGGGRVRYLR